MPRIGRLSGVPETSLPATWLEGLVSGTDECLGTPSGAEQEAAHSPTSPTDTATRLCAPGGCVPTRSSDSPGWRQNLQREGL